MDQIRNLSLLTLMVYRPATTIILHSWMGCAGKWIKNLRCPASRPSNYSRTTGAWHYPELRAAPLALTGIGDVCLQQILR